MSDTKKMDLVGRAFGRTASTEKAINALLKEGYRELKSNDTKARIFIKSQKTPDELELFNEILNEYKAMEKTGRRIDDAINAAIRVFLNRKRAWFYDPKQEESLSQLNQLIGSLFTRYNSMGLDEPLIDAQFQAIFSQLDKLNGE